MAIDGMTCTLVRTINHGRVTQRLLGRPQTHPSKLMFYTLDWLLKAQISEMARGSIWRNGITDPGDQLYEMESTL
jgi:hypothetical protein